MNTLLFSSALETPAQAASRAVRNSSTRYALRILLVLLLVAFSYSAAQAQQWNDRHESRTNRGIFHPKGVPLKSVITFDSGNLKSGEEGVLFATLEGLLAKTSPEQIFLDEGGPSDVWISFLSMDKKDYPEITVTWRPYSDVWSLVDHFRSEGLVGGYILYNDSTNSASMNAATTLAGLYHAVAVDASIESSAIAHGLSKLADASAATDQSMYDSYFAWTNPLGSSEVDPGVTYHNRDYASMANFFAFYSSIGTTVRTAVMQSLGQHDGFS
jgi:GxGYxYP_N second domain